jgi:FixJ family two-component response regulator
MTALSAIPQAAGWVAIVDDDESIRRSLSRVFQMNGIDARPFCSAEDYLNRVNGDEPRCMVLDVHMPGLSGFELEDQLRNRGRAPPIIFMTALDQLTSSRPERRDRPCGYLRKPFDTLALLDLVRMHVSSQSP